jgi:2-keto-4-pentenoate hydratase
LSALRLWLARDGRADAAGRRAAGEVVTTGTLTDAWPLQPGEIWHTQTDDLRLPGLRLHCRP